MTIVLDLGGVLGWGDGVWLDLAQMCDADPDAFAQAYWAVREEYDAGLSAFAYWQAVLAMVGIECEPEIAEELTRRDLAAWLRLRPATRELLRELKERGETVVILSNAADVFVDAIAAQPWSAFVDHVVVSGVVGVCKPDPRIYAAVEAIAPGPYLFVDDRQDNVDAAARRVGWTAHLWTDDAETREWLLG